MLIQSTARGGGAEIPCLTRTSIEAFCLRMLRRKYFDMSNRWYAPVLRRPKSENGGGLNNFVGVVSLRNLC